VGFCIKGEYGLFIYIYKSVCKVCPSLSTLVPRTISKNWAVY
jgi:hypothetical protein